MKLKLLSSIIFVLCISLFLSLGFWQLDRAEEKDRNSQSLFGKTIT